MALPLRRTLEIILILAAILALGAIAYHYATKHQTGQRRMVQTEKGANNPLLHYAQTPIPGIIYPELQHEVHMNIPKLRPYTEDLWVGKVHYIMVKFPGEPSQIRNYTEDSISASFLWELKANDKPKPLRTEFARYKSIDRTATVFIQSGTRMWQLDNERMKQLR